MVIRKYYDNGFKRWPADPSGTIRVLIIGDSMTEMTQVSNGEEWYAYLESAFDQVDFFVFGSGGYGSLQEFLILDRYADQISPDVLLWQFCLNDYANNYYQLDLRDYPSSNHAYRPYLEDGEIFYRLPLPFLRAREVSFIADRVLAVYDRLRLRSFSAALATNLTEKVRRDEKRPDHESLFQQAHATTSVILKNVRERIPEIPIYFVNFCGPTSAPEYSLCDNAQLLCVDGLQQPTAAREAAGEVLRATGDLHWNLAGNRVVGQWLVKYFEDQGVFGGL